MITRICKVKNYRELYDYVKNVKNIYNLDNDTSEFVDSLIFKWFSSGGIRALDRCYHEFNKILKEKNGLDLRIEDGEVIANWE